MADPKFEITAVDRFSRVLRDARRQFDGLKGSLGSMSGVAGVLSSNLAGLAASLSVGGLVAGFKSLVDGIDDLSDRAQGLGTTAVALSEMQLSARLAGIGAEELSAAVTRLNVRLTDAAAGGKESQAVFRAMGIALRDSSGNLKSTEQVLGEVADRFASYRDGAEKSALAVDLFGRAGAKLVNYLNQGAQGLRTYSGLSEETVRANAKMAAEFDKLAANAERAKNAIAGALVPAVNALFDAFSRGSTEQQIGEIETIIASLNQQANASSAANLQMYTEQLAKLKAQLSDERLQRFLAGGRAARGADSPAPRAPVVGSGSGIPGVPKPEQISASRSALAQYVEQLQRAQDALEEIGEVERTLQFLKENPSIDTPQVRDLLLNQAQIVDTLRAEKQLREELARATGEQIAASAALRESVLEAAGILEEQRKIAQTGELERLIAEGVINPEQAERAVKAIAGIRDEVEKTKSVSDELGLVFESAFEDAIVGARSFKDVLKGLADDMLRLFLRQNVTKPLFDFFGSSMPFLFGGGRAGGGPVYPGMTYLVGEKGPELLTLGSSGRVTPNGAMGGVTVVQNIRIDSRADAASIREAMEATRRRTEASIMDSMRRRGAFARA